MIANLLLKVVGILMMLTALAVAMSRAPDRPVETLVARWAPPPSDFVDVRGQIVHLRDEGPRADPAPLVLLHGTSSSLHTWEGWVRELRREHRVITLDVPGFGLTGPFTGRHAPDDYRGDTLARFVLEVLDQLGVQRFGVGGNSMGGEIAWRIASMAPQRVQRLVLVDASGTRFEPESLPLGFWLVRIPVLNQLGQYLLPRALVAQGLVNTYGHAERVTAELVDRYYELALRDGNRRALGLRAQQLERGDHVDRIAALRLPTLILWGGRDRLIPPPVAEEFHRMIPGSQLKVYPDLGHLPHEEDPAATLPELQRFLAETAPAAAAP